MNKKAQIFGQPFIFIFAIIVAAMVLAFGIEIYFDLQQRTDFALAADNIQKINEAVTTFYNLEEGSSNTFKYKFPTSIDCICFLEEATSSVSLTGKCDDSTLESDIINAPSGQTVLWKYNEKTRRGENPASLRSQFRIKSPFVTVDMSATPPVGVNPLCFDLTTNNHILEIKLKSQGDKVLIKET